MVLARVYTVFDCKHEKEIEVSIDDDIVVPESVRGLGSCPDCKGEQHVVAISGVAPQPGGQQLVLESILMMEIEG
jgi:hypothetical protein